MKNGIGKKIAYILIAIVFIVVLCIGLLNKFNVIGNKDVNENETVLSSWSSEPIGDAGFYVTVESKKSQTVDDSSGSIMCTFNTVKGKSESSGTLGILLEQLKNLTYDDLVGFNISCYDYENNVGYFSFFVPSDCEYFILNDNNRFTMQDVSLKTDDGKVDFKMCIGFVNIDEIENYEKENIVCKVTYIDKKGNSYDCSEKLDEEG